MLVLGARANDPILPFQDAFRAETNDAVWLRSSGLRCRADPLLVS